jgi:hypothetical protein
MRKINYFLAALGAIMMASCANDDFLGENPGTTPQTKEESPILFSGGATNLTRADLYGAEAATKLGNKFVVYGTKHMENNAEDETADNDNVVFKNFQVAWQENTAGTTESNSSNWEYVGKQSYDAQSKPQGIKYWDYNADKGYTFYAFSYHKDSPTANAPGLSYPMDEDKDDVKVVKTTSDESSLYNKGYKVTVKPTATLNNLYFSDRLTVAKADYDKTVTLTFRNVGAKVRVGFYETIPGYDVTIDKFYIDENASGAVTDFAEMKDGKTNGFYAALQNVKKSANQTINVTYYEEGTVINRPKVSNPTGGYDYYLKLGNGTGIINKTLSDNSAAPTWVAGKTADNYYIPVYPFEGNTTPMLVKLDFTMKANDGSDDEIHVRGARAIVPAAYVQWKCNFAYTYLFKISDKTNGTTGDVDDNDDPITDPEGLKAITFDAVVVDITDERQETITSLSSNSITTYAEGAIANEYKKGQPIYVVVSDNFDLNDPNHYKVITPSGIGDEAGEAQVYSIDRATSEAEVLAQLTGSPIGLDMDPVDGASVETTVPLTDGTKPAIDNVKFTPATAGTYAYVYTTKAYVAPEYEAVTTNTYDSGTTYYLRSGAAEPYVYYAVSVPTKDAFEDNIDKLYKVKTGKTGTAGVYDVKVIKVQD